MTAHRADETFMHKAIVLARKGQGKVAPNPCVGAVLVQEGRIVAKGYHRVFGGPHAEIVAMEQARKLGVDFTRCTLYVTLEPCNHQGKTPPCTRAILETKIPRVVIGVLDPNPGVQGGGAAFLQSRGVEVKTGVAQAECKNLIADFCCWLVKKRPYLYLKLASTLDGKIATRTGHSSWVSGPQARQEVHDLRSQVQAIMVGGETFYQDNPRLTCRLPGMALQRQPDPVVVTSRLPGARANFHLLGKGRRAIFWTSQELAGSEQAKALQDIGHEVWGLPPWAKGGLDLVQGLQRLFAEKKCYYVLCEGGGHLALGLIQQGVVDELRLYLAPKVLGDVQARALFAGRAVEEMTQAIEWDFVTVRQCGSDLALVLRPRRTGGPLQCC